MDDRNVLRFDITPLPGETQRGCNALIRAVMPPSRRSAVMIALYAVIIVAAYFIAPTTRPQTVIIGVGAVLATEGLLRLESNTRLRKLQAADLHGAEPYHVELSDIGVRTWCEHVEARYPWGDFVRATENAEFYLLVRPGGGGAAIPKRLVDPAQSDGLEAMVSRRLDSRTTWSTTRQAI